MSGLNELCPVAGSHANIFLKELTMAYHVRMSPEDRRLESMADKLIDKCSHDAEFPVLREKSLAYSGRKLINLEWIPENTAALPQSQREELLFLITVTCMTEDVRLCLQLWIDGWTQCEIASIMVICQQRVSQLLRKGLRDCFENVPISFREFSKHTVYHHPYHVSEKSIIRYCIRCKEAYESGKGHGKYCSVQCAESHRHGL